MSARKTMPRACARRRLGLAALAAGAALLAGCALLRGPQLALGQTEAELVAQLGPPSARFLLADGAQRLQWVGGPFGRRTWMADLGADGRSRWFAQVLTRAYLWDFARRAPGLNTQELLRELGRPAEQQLHGWGGGQTWSWRYETNDCLWWQVSIDKSGTVTSAGDGPDPLCEIKEPLRER